MYHRHVLLRSITLLLAVSLAAGELAARAALAPTKEAMPGGVVAPAIPPITWQCWDLERPDPLCHGPLYAVDMLSADDGWAVGDQGVILHWDGQAWSHVPGPTTEPLYALDMLSSTDGWAGGGSEPGVLLHWDGVAWALATTGLQVSEITVIDAVAPNEVWLAGAQWLDWRHSIKRIYRWDGSSWTLSYETWLGPIAGMELISPADGWATADCAVLHWNGVAWTETNVDLPTL
jgi:hypothetical protein